MSFTGDLEHLPIVDVVQLLHSTRKSGTLCVKSGKGESQLVFRDGFIVSANHSKNNIRIGQILVEMEFITTEVLRKALAAQKAAGKNKKPLIATLIEDGQIDRDDGYKGLEYLIEMTVVEILTWKSGTFILDVDSIKASDEYEYYPAKFDQDFNLDTQRVLMDALRIYDEKKRDGEIGDEDFYIEDAFEEADEPLLPEGGNEDQEDADPSLSAVDLGLADLDLLEQKIPDVFSSLGGLDPAEGHATKVSKALEGLAVGDQQKLVSFLEGFPEVATGAGRAMKGPRTRPLILVTEDEFLGHAAETICRHEGIGVTLIGDELDLTPALDRSLTAGAVPLLVFDGPLEAKDALSQGKRAALQTQLAEIFPESPIVRFAPPDDLRSSLQAYRDGIAAVIPRPARGEKDEAFAEDTIEFLEAFHAYLKRPSEPKNGQAGTELLGAVESLRGLKDASEISFVLLRRAAETFERAITFIVGRNELLAEKVIGVGGEAGKGKSNSLDLRIPLTGSKAALRLVETGGLFFGEIVDNQFTRPLFEAIGPPRHSEALLLALKIHGKPVALIYGDSGQNAPSPFPGPDLEILASHAGLVLENALCRKQLKKVSQQ